ncbi:MAG: putative C-S lyase [Colwellia sp.]|nr:putative C-S lyase [Colwellia sp.]
MNEFDQIIDRSNTNSLAIEGFVDYLFKGDVSKSFSSDYTGLISMWVADMAFAAPSAATNAMIKRISHPVFGYTMNFDERYYRAFLNWTEKRYGWTFAKESLHISSGVIPALFDLIDQICEPGDKVLTLTPAYGYFKHAADHHQNELVSCSLKFVEGEYFIDFDDLRIKTADPKSKLFFLCHPHNPTGRIWTDEELQLIGEICIKNKVVIVSDEIHCDLLRNNKTHTPLAKLFPDSDQIITCMAPSKTFNLAGLMLANIIIPNPELRAMWQKRTQAFVNPISLAAAHGVYENGHEWLHRLRGYLDENFSVLENELKAHLPDAIFKIPDATYLAWIDLSAYLPASVNLTRLFLDEAGVIIEGGEMFISDGGIRIRMNVACPRSQLKDALKRVIKVVKNFN